MKRYINKFNHIHPSNFIYLSLIFCSMILFFSSCKKDFNFNYEPTIADDYLVYHQVSNNDTIILFSTGGPVDVIDTKEDLQDFFDFFPYSFATVYQAQMKDPKTLYNYTLSNEDAELLNNKSAEILNNTIKHFKEQGKFVVVWGISYGSFLSMRTIQNYGVTADKYSCFVGRINMPQEIVDKFAEYKWTWHLNGTNPYSFKYVLPKDYWATFTMIYNIANNNFSETLASTDLKKLLYLTHTQDENVGALTQAEKDFLTSKNAKVITNAGDHFTNEIDFADMLEFIRE